MDESNTKKIQLAVTVLGVVAGLFNVYVASKLAPLEQDFALLNQKVAAVQAGVQQINTIYERFIVVEQNVKDLKEIQIKMDAKLDILQDLVNSGK